MGISFLLILFVGNLSLLDSLYQSGDYAGVLKEGEIILRQELKKEERVEALKIIAFSAIALNQEEKAKGHFSSLLQLSPNFFLDPIKTSPKIMRVFQEARDEFRKKRKEEIGRSPLIYFYPGLFQLKDGRRFKGYFLASLTTISTVGFLTGVILTPIFHRSYLEKRTPSEVESAYRLYKSAYIAQQVFGISLLFAYSFHLLDIKLSE